MTGAVLERPSLSLADIKEALTTLLRVRQSLIDLKARSLSVAEIEDVNRTIHALQEDLKDRDAECARLAHAVEAAERRASFYQQKLEEADFNLASLQRSISQALSEHVTDVDIFQAQMADADTIFNALPR